MADFVERFTEVGVNDIHLSASIHAALDTVRVVEQVGDGGFTTEEAMLLRYDGVLEFFEKAVREIGL